MEYRPEIQLEMFATKEVREDKDESQLLLLRSHRWANKVDGTIPLMEISLKPHNGQWMWAVCLNSSNGSGQGYAPLPKWGKFADSRAEAAERAVEEVRLAMTRATKDERQRILQWCGEVLAGQYL